MHYCEITRQARKGEITKRVIVFVRELTKVFTRDQMELELTGSIMD